MIEFANLAKKKHPLCGQQAIIWSGEKSQRKVRIKQNNKEENRKTVRKIRLKAEVVRIRIQSLKKCRGNSRALPAKVGMDKRR